jgi:hypothetical protein
MSQQLTRCCHEHVYILLLPLQVPAELAALRATAKAAASLLTTAPQPQMAQSLPLLTVLRSWATSTRKEGTVTWCAR